MRTAAAQAPAEVRGEMSPEQAADLLPRDVMLWVMRRAVLAGDDQLALKAAGDVAPYCHPRLSHTKVDLERRPVTAMSDEELMAIVAAGEDMPPGSVVN